MTETARNGILIWLINSWVVHLTLPSARFFFHHNIISQWIVLALVASKLLFQVCLNNLKINLHHHKSFANNKNNCSSYLVISLAELWTREWGRIELWNAFLIEFLAKLQFSRNIWYFRLESTFRIIQVN